MPARRPPIKVLLERLRQVIDRAGDLSVTLASLCLSNQQFEKYVFVKAPHFNFDDVIEFDWMTTVTMEEASSFIEVLARENDYHDKILTAVVPNCEPGRLSTAYPHFWFAKAPYAPSSTRRPRSRSAMSTVRYSRE